MSDDAKKVVLARRAKFVAAALAGMSIACGKENAPHPCLDVPPPQDAASTTPQPCLSVEIIPTPGPPPTARAPDASPRPCLQPIPPSDKDAGR